MRNTDHLTDEQLRESMNKPLSSSAAARRKKAIEDSRWLLALNLEEMKKRESDPNYDPADDPTCVLISTESDEE
ncbi:MAG: hypothetical protein WC460_06040 [Patescibacteria group bacterium]